MPPRRSVFSALVCLLLLSNIANAGGGPNFIEGTSIGSLFIAPLLGSFVFFILLFFSSARWVAIALTSFAIFFSVLASAASDVFLVGALIFGPWVLFILLSLVSVVTFLASMARSNTGEKSGSSESGDSPEPDTYAGEAKPLYGIYDESGNLMPISEASKIIMAFDREELDDFLIRFTGKPSSVGESIEELRDRCVYILKAAN